MKTRLSVFHAILLGCMGCIGSRERYEVAIRVDNQGTHRSMTGWTEPTNESDSDNPLSEITLDRLRSVYGIAGEMNGGHTTFSGVYANELPQDVGGYGSVEQFESTLGILSVYSERFRGSDDLVGQWEKQADAVDRFCVLIGDWAEANATDREEGESIKEFINGEFRADLLNVAMHIYAFAIRYDVDAPNWEEIKYRLLQFAVEHQYLNSGSFDRVLNTLNDQHGEGFLNLTLEGLERRRGDTHPRFSEVIPALASMESFHSSLNAFLYDTPEGAEMRRKSEGNSEPDYSFLLVKLILSAVRFELDGGGVDSVAVQLDLAVRPFETNGTWDEDARHVSWETQLEGFGDRPRSILPTLCYASWAEPDFTFQQEHFGRVVFADKPLADCILWYQTLDESEVKQWERFLTGLTPERDLQIAFERFRFDGEPTSTEEVRLLSDAPRQLLQNALDDADASR